MFFFVGSMLVSESVGSFSERDWDLCHLIFVPDTNKKSKKDLRNSRISTSSRMPSITQKSRAGIHIFGSFPGKSSGRKTKNPIREKSADRNSICLPGTCLSCLNPPKQGLFQSKQGSFGFQVYIDREVLLVPSSGTL